MEYVDFHTCQDLAFTRLNAFCSDVIYCLTQANVQSFNGILLKKRYLNSAKPPCSTHLEPLMHLN